MKLIPIGLAALLVAWGAPLAPAQEGQDPRPAPEAPEDDELTPEQAMELLEEAHRLMGKAEELLNDSSRGKALETERELLEKLERELRDDPALAQKAVLEKVGRLVEKAQKRQKDAAGKLQELIKRAKS